MRSLLYSCLISLLAASFFFANYDIVRHVDQADTNKNIRIQGASHLDVKTVRRKDVSSKNNAAVDSSENHAELIEKQNSKRRDYDKYSKPESNYHDNAVLITHYHKTGYVLSRELMFLLHQIELEVNRHEAPSKNRGIQLEVSGVDSEGERFAFDSIGSWARSAFSTRKHNIETQCPFPVARKKKTVLPKTTGFTLRDETIYVQESPDLYCSDEDILNGLSLSHKGGTKIIHFVRNPYEMVLSNYFYHSQEPTPEKWVHSDNPCEHKYEDGKTLSSYVAPALAQELNKPERYFTKQLETIGTMCQELFQSTKELKNATFYEHLLNLDKYDGLRLATAQMVAASGMSNGYWAGGDVLRMANNLIKFKRLQEASTPDNKIEVYTVVMGDFIKNMANSTYAFFNFILGEDDRTIPKQKIWNAALQQEEKYAKKKNRAHITQTNKDDQKIKAMLKERLSMDPDLSFILNITEDLVNEALSK